MRLELCKGNYFIFDDKPQPLADQEYDLRMWLYHNGFEGNIERRSVYTLRPPYFSPENQYNTYDNTYYMDYRQEIGYLLNYRQLYSYTDDIYKTEFIKNGMCIVSTGSHLLFLNPGEYEILQSGLKILPNE